VKSYKLSIRINTSEYGVVETKMVDFNLTRGKFVINSVVVFEKVEDGIYLFKETLPIKQEENGRKH
jgi:hypothetical protein